MLPPWLVESWRTLATALATQRLHHGLLFAAPAGLGKRALAEAFVRAALCERRDHDGYACGSCRACALLAAGSHPDLVRVGLELRDDRSRLTCRRRRGHCRGRRPGPRHHLHVAGRGL